MQDNTDHLKLILHAGPMKTGSTAVQLFLRQQKKTLAGHGLRFTMLGQAADLKARLDEEFTALPEGGRGVIASSEFFCFQPPKKFREALADRDLERHAILVHRPLSVVYVSLYLQNLKGPSVSTADFESFAAQQMKKDAAPRAGKGTTYNYAFLEENLAEAGFAVHWVEYSREGLLPDIVAFMNRLMGTGLSTEYQTVFRKKMDPLSPLRSLNMLLAEPAREVNRLYHRGVLDEAQRKHLLGKMIDASTRIEVPSRSFVAPELMAEIEALDQEINGAFYAQQKATSAP